LASWLWLGTGCFALDGCLFEQDSAATGAGGGGAGGSGGAGGGAGGAGGAGGGGGGGAGPSTWLIVGAVGGEAAVQLRAIDADPTGSGFVVLGTVDWALERSFQLGPCGVGNPSHNAFVAFFSWTGECQVVVSFDAPVSTSSFAIAHTGSTSAVVAATELFKIDSTSVTPITNCQAEACVIEDVVGAGESTGGVYAVGWASNRDVSISSDCNLVGPNTGANGALLFEYISATNACQSLDLPYEAATENVKLERVAASDGNVHVVGSSTASLSVEGGSLCDNRLDGSCSFRHSVRGDQAPSFEPLSPDRAPCLPPIATEGSSLWGLDAPCDGTGLRLEDYFTPGLSNNLSTEIATAFPLDLAVSPTQVFGVGRADPNGPGGLTPFGFILQAKQGSLLHTLLWAAAITEPSLDWLPSEISAVTAVPSRIAAVGRFTSAMDGPARVAIREGLGEGPDLIASEPSPIDCPPAGTCERPFIAVFEPPAL
jgi:hypothetical protein